MKIILKIFLLILTTMQFCCNGNQIKVKENNAAIAPPENLFANIHFASKNDTSCGMPLTAGIGDTLHLGNKIYGFCSKECKDEFAKQLKSENKR